MHVQINGKATKVEPGMTLADFMAKKGLKPESVVIEHNGTILPRERWREVALTSADQLHIVSFVGGG